MKMSGTVSIESIANDVTKKPLTKSASEHRRATKPLMEKRRRARINHSLNELKSLILDALHKDPSRHSKLEKADILEMTVRYLQNMQKQQTAAAIATDPNVLNKFRAGFTECATEVTRYISRVEGVESALKQRLMQHLSSCVASVSNVATTVNSSFAGAANVAFPGMIPPAGNPPNVTPLHVQIPLSGLPKPSNDINNNNPLDTKLSSTPSSASSTLFTFTFPPHHVSQNLLSPQTPSSPTTPSVPRNVSINICYNNNSNNNNEFSSLPMLNGNSSSPYRYSSSAYESWNHLPSSHGGPSSLSPGSSSLRSLSPVGSDSHDVEMTADIESRVKKASEVVGPKCERLSHSVPSSNSVWRPW